jgi:hypothetical protein
MILMPCRQSFCITDTGQKSPAYASHKAGFLCPVIIHHIGGAMFDIEIINLNRPALANGCPAIDNFQADSLLGARFLAEKIAKERNLQVNDWFRFGGDAWIGHGEDQRPVVRIMKI